MINPLRFLFKSSKLPDPKPAKAPPTQQVIPYFAGVGKDVRVADRASNLTSLDLAQFPRDTSTMNEAIKALVLSSPDLSLAVETKIKTAIPGRFSAIAYDNFGKVDVKGTALLQSFLLRLNYGASDYTTYQNSSDLRSASATLLYDSFRYGGMAAELVCGQMRLPAFIKPFSFRRVLWADNMTDAYPIYRSRTGMIPLNFPTIFISTTTKDPESPFAESPLQSVIQACLWDAEFTNSLRRAATKNLLQRLKVVIKSDLYMKTLPIEVQTDKTQLDLHMKTTVATLEKQLADLNPEDSIVIFDILEATTMQDANRSEDRSIAVLQALIDGRVSAGAKILPAIIGRGQSSNAASTESMLFLKAIAAAQLELNTFLSRMLSFALKLFGFDSYAIFAYEEANLRPELELASFRAQKQSTTLELLSFGFISDEEASIDLTGTLPSGNFKPLSGTLFEVKKTAAANPYSNTSVDTTSGKTDATQAVKDNTPNTKGVIGVKK